MPSLKPTLVVMVKEPRAGRVKTRLGKDIGMVPAAWWFRHQAQRLLRHVDDPRWRLVLAVSPDTAALTSRFWPHHLPRWPQGRGDLGQRMARMMYRAHGPVCVIGADIPAIRRTHIARAFALLGSNRAVFGPATDGGYWLVGLRRPRPLPAGLFAGVTWSGPDTLAQSMTSLRGASIGLADRLRDVDTADDLP